MDKCIFAGCALHDKNMLLTIALDKGAAQTRAFSNDVAGTGALGTSHTRVNPRLSD